MKRIAISGLILIALAGLYFERREILINLIAFEMPPGLSDATDQGPNVRWADDYYTIEQIDERAFAIAEPRYAQHN